MQVRGGVLFNDDGSVYEGSFGDAVLAALGAGGASAGDVLTADGNGGAAFDELPA